MDKDKRIRFQMVSQTEREVDPAYHKAQVEYTTRWIAEREGYDSGLPILSREQAELDRMAREIYRKGGIDKYSTAIDMARAALSAREVE